jgi:hypothetical protein
MEKEEVILSDGKDTIDRGLAKGLGRFLRADTTLREETIEAIEQDTLRCLQEQRIKRRERGDDPNRGRSG